MLILLRKSPLYLILKPWDTFGTPVDNSIKSVKQVTILKIVLDSVHSNLLYLTSTRTKDKTNAPISQQRNQVTPITST